MYVCIQSPSGGCLVDACCLSGSLGHLHVAAAGKWAVCLWTQTSDSDWSLVHTWSFNEVSVWACLHRCVVFWLYVLDLLIFNLYLTGFNAYFLSADGDQYISGC